MKIRVFTKDGRNWDGRFYSRSEYNTSIEVEKNDVNDLNVREILTDEDCEVKYDVTDYRSYWFIILSNRDIMKIVVLNNE